ncbi:MAG: trigger factor, partial [Armatimonadetes bacterium]|nr:trigger factor [Armatimonadota bacterium]
VKPLPGSQLQLTITLGAEEVNSFFDKVYRRLSQSGRIRGFRPGKAPKTIIRHVFGEDQIRASAYVEMLEDVLPKALETLGRQVLGDPALPALEEVELAEDKGVTLPVTVSVYPEAEVGELGEIKILRPSVEVTEKEVDEMLEELREEKATWQEVSRAVAPGDRVTIDLAIYYDDELKATREGVSFMAIAPEEDEEQSAASKVVGHFVGQTVVADAKPSQSAEAEEAVTRRTEATIRKVEEKVLPAVDDDFARSLGDYDNLEALKEDIRAQLRTQKERRARERIESQALAHLLAVTDVEIPEILLEHITAARLDNLEEELKSIGSSLQELADAGTLDLQKIQDGERQRAAVGLEVKLALEALTKRENLVPEEQDIEEEIEELARRTRNDVDFVRQAYELQDDVREQIDSRAIIRRAVRWVIERAQIEEVQEEEFEERYRQLLEELEERRRQRREATAKQAAAETGETGVPGAETQPAAELAEKQTQAEGAGQAATPGPALAAEQSVAQPPAAEQPATEQSTPEQGASGGAAGEGAGFEQSADVQGASEEVDGEQSAAGEAAGDQPTDEQSAAEQSAGD